MRIGVLVAAEVALTLLAQGAAAQCVTADDLARGILFDRQDAGTGTAIAMGGGAVQVDYDAGTQGYTDRRDMALGVYETAMTSVSAPPDVIGVWSEWTATRDFAGRFPAPEAGLTWETTVTVRWEMSDFSGMPQSGRERLSAVYAFLEPNVVTLSGCAYQVIPVEVRLTSGERDQTRRYAYFPAVGVAIETRVTDNLTGDVVTNGITGLRPAT
jgi:hypothetical protein